MLAPTSNAIPLGRKNESNADRFSSSYLPLKKSSNDSERDSQAVDGAPWPYSSARSALHQISIVATSAYSRCAPDLAHRRAMSARRVPGGAAALMRVGFSLSVPKIIERIAAELVLRAIAVDRDRDSGVYTLLDASAEAYAIHGRGMGEIADRSCRAVWRVRWITRGQAHPSQCAARCVEDRIKLASRAGKSFTPVRCRRRWARSRNVAGRVAGSELKCAKEDIGKSGLIWCI
jgi:hypothetical protein